MPKYRISLTWYREHTATRVVEAADQMAAEDLFDADDSVTAELLAAEYVPCDWPEPSYTQAEQ